MVPYEYLLSESQERMLFVAHKGREQDRYFPPLGTSCSCGRDGYFRTSGADSVPGEVAAQIPAEALRIRSITGNVD